MPNLAQFQNPSTRFRQAGTHSRTICGASGPRGRTKGSRKGERAASPRRRHGPAFIPRCSRLAAGKVETAFMIGVAVHNGNRRNRAPANCIPIGCLENLARMPGSRLRGPGPGSHACIRPGAVMAGRAMGCDACACPYPGYAAPGAMPAAMGLRSRRARPLRPEQEW